MKKEIHVVPIKGGAWALSCTDIGHFVAVCDNKKEAIEGATWWVIFNPKYKRVVHDKSGKVCG